MTFSTGKCDGWQSSQTHFLLLLRQTDTSFSRTQVVRLSKLESQARKDCHEGDSAAGNRDEAARTPTKRRHRLGTTPVMPTTPPSNAEVSMVAMDECTIAQFNFEAFVCASGLPACDPVEASDGERTRGAVTGLTCVLCGKHTHMHTHFSAATQTLPTDCSPCSWFLSTDS